MQPAFPPEGATRAPPGLPFEALVPAVAPCRELIALARSHGVPVIYTRYVYRHDFRDAGLLAGELMPVLREQRALVAGSADAEIIAELAPEPEDFVVDKNRPSAFYATPLETWLHGLGVKELVVCGVTTNCCVETTVRDASQRDYRCFVIGDAVAEFDPERHRVALESMAMLFGYVIGLAALKAHWESHA